jgi:enamine deaminase RidA (YjgF/YER057c/UK114 family)
MKHTTMKCSVLALGLYVAIVLVAASSAQHVPLVKAAQQGPSSKAGEKAANGTSAEKHDAVKYLSPDTLFQSDAYSKIAIVNTPSRTVYFSGSIPVDKGYNVVGRDDLRAQLKQALKNLSLAMDAAGVSKNEVVKVSVSVLYKDNRDTFTVSEEVALFFARDDPPTMTITGSPFIIADGILVQIEAIAVLPS